jgi:hypothetical protein
MLEKCKKLKLSQSLSKNVLFFFLGLGLLVSQKGFAQILLPPPPKPSIPPARPKETPGTSEWDKRREELKEAEEPELTPTQSRDEELRVENEKPRDMRLMMQVTLVAPWILTGEKRRSYTSDLTSHFKAYYRLSSAPVDASGSWWTGLRIAPFAGTGTHGFTTGNYGFTYFGPAFGYGKVTRSTIEKNRTHAGMATSAPLPSGNRKTWMVMGGVAMQNRVSTVEDSDDTPEEDFDSKPFAYDAPGTWIEASWGTIRWGAVSTEMVMGVQIGSGKTFVWLGVGAAGWD